MRINYLWNSGHLITPQRVGNSDNTKEGELASLFDLVKRTGFLVDKSEAPVVLDGRTEGEDLLPLKPSTKERLAQGNWNALMWGKL